MGPPEPAEGRFERDWNTRARHSKSNLKRNRLKAGGLLNYLHATFELKDAPDDELELRSILERDV